MNKIILNKYTCINCKCITNNIHIEYINDIEYKNKAIYKAVCSKCNKKSYVTIKLKRYYYYDKDKTLFLNDIIIPIQQFLTELKKIREKELLNIKRQIKIKGY